MLQEKIDQFRRSGESEFHHFVHGIVTEPENEPGSEAARKTGIIDTVGDPMIAAAGSEDEKVPRKRWKSLKCDGASAVGFTLGMSTEASKVGTSAVGGYLRHEYQSNKGSKIGR